MCRNIKQLRSSEVSPTDEDISLAALQFVRKVSGFRKPSKANQAAFDAAVVEVSEATTRLLEAIGALAQDPAAGSMVGAESVKA